MKAIVCERYGPEALELREVEQPEIEEDQVLVRVHASSVNPAEWYGVTGPVLRTVGSGLRRPKSTGSWAATWPAAWRPSARTYRDSSGRRGVRHGTRSVGRVRARP